MRTGIELMYVEGEVSDGYLTGRRILVIETNFEIDPTAPDQATADFCEAVRSLNVPLVYASPSVN